MVFWKPSLLFDFADITVEFVPSNEYSVNEEDELVTITLRVSGFPSEEFDIPNVQVLLFTEDITTTSKLSYPQFFSGLWLFQCAGPIDFEGSIDILTFSSDEERNVTISIERDGIVEEPQETFRVNLASPNEFVLFPNTPAIVTIIDNDSKYMYT